jgi:hypothetical protein
MITPYTAQQPVTDYSLRFPGILYSCRVPITTDTTLTIPGDYSRYKAVIKCCSTAGTLPGEVWVALNQTAAQPAGTIFASTTSEMLNEYQTMCHDVSPGDILHFFSSTATTDVSVVLYSVGSLN